MSCTMRYLKNLLYLLIPSILLTPLSLFAQGELICPPVQVVFAVDTSGSMNDEASALCDSIVAVESGLASNGVSAQSFIWGITQDASQAGNDFSCLNDSVANAIGVAVPGENGSCGMTLSDSESWGEAISIVSTGFPWDTGAVRVVVPISDEGACDGGSGDCTDPSEDLDSLSNATTLALANNVFVSPIAGTGSSDCVKTQGQDIANATGGEWFESTDPQFDLVGAVNNLILSACEQSNNPPTAQCQDVVVNADDSCQANASVDNGSFDSEGGAVTVSASPEGPYPLGETLVTLTVVDNGGLESTCSATVTVLEEKEDGSSCFGPQEVVCNESDSSETLFALDGNARQQRRFASRLIRKAARAGGKKKRARRLRKDAREAFQNAWATVWQNPTTTLSCEQSVSCSVNPLSTVKSETLSRLELGYDITRKAAKFLRKQSQRGEPLFKRAKRTLKRAKKLFDGAQTQVSGLPAEQTVCNDVQVNIVPATE